MGGGKRMEKKRGGGEKEKKHRKNNVPEIIFLSKNNFGVMLNPILQRNNMTRKKKIIHFIFHLQFRFISIN